MGSADPADLTDPIRRVPSGRSRTKLRGGQTPPGPWSARDSLRSLGRDGFLVAGVFSVLPHGAVWTADIIHGTCEAKDARSRSGDGGRMGDVRNRRWW